MAHSPRLVLHPSSHGSSLQAGQWTAAHDFFGAFRYVLVSSSIAELAQARDVVFIIRCVIIRCVIIRCVVIEVNALIDEFVGRCVNEVKGFNLGE
jgi:hypothetical protein